MSSINPKELLTANGRPRSLGLSSAVSLAQLGRDYGMKTAGEDIEISFLLSYPNGAASGPVLTYFDASSFDGSLPNLQRILIVNEKDKIAIDRSKSVSCALLITDKNPKLAFCEILNDLQGKGRFELLQSFSDAKANIAKSAIVHSNVYISKGAVIADGVVLLPNTFVGEDVSISANATIGTDSIGLFAAGTPRLRVSHAGGVWLDSGVEVGPVSCIDRGISGEFTYVGVESKIDNLIHIASGVTIGRHCSLPGSSYVGNDAVIEDGAWIGPKTVIDEGVRIGANAYVGIGCLIATDQPSQALVYALNSRAYGWACYCRNRLEFVGGAATCSQCGKKFELSPEKTVVPV